MNVVISMARRYPTGFEITDGRGNTIADNDTTNDHDTDSYYDPTNNLYNTSDPTPDTPDENSIYDDSIYKLYNYDADIILNHYVVDHYIPISGVVTNHNDLRAPEA